MTHSRVADYEVAPDLFPDTLAFHACPEPDQGDPISVRATRALPYSLSDVELVALYLDLPPAMALKRAHDALLDAGGLRPLVDLSTAKLRQIPGFGPRAVAQLKASVEIGRRHLTTRLERSPAITTPAKLFSYFTAKLRHHDVEVFAILHFDNRHRPLGYHELTRGTIDSASVHAREVVRSAIAHNSSAVVFGHNHPAGIAEPSIADRLLTQGLIAALATIEVRVLDHIVVGDGEAVSFSQSGLIT